MSVTFATSCYERDWRQILLSDDYLAKKQISHHCFPFMEQLLVINNVEHLGPVVDAARKKVKEGHLTKFVIAEEVASEQLNFFGLEKGSFSIGSDAHLYLNVNNDWIYYNALGPLTSIYCAKGDYLLYQTGDVRLDRPVSWIKKAILLMEQESLYKVANLLWNGNKKEAKREAMCFKKGFYVSSRGFSDQMFLIQTNVWRRPIYHEMREDASHFPRGDVFEKRAYSAMKNRGWYRLTYRCGSYTHENF